MVDITQRPSQCALAYLNNVQHVLRRRNIGMVFIQVKPIAKEVLQAWKKENGITVPIEILPGDPDTVMEHWGVRSLPWATLTDRNHTIIKDGFLAGKVLRLTEDSEPRVRFPNTSQSSPRRSRR